jgi:hypothetical protein
MAAHTPPDAAFAPSVQPDQPATAWAPWLREIAGAVNQLGAKTTALAAGGGSTGPAGPPGPTGPAGPTGATGATGPAGSANMSGMTAGQIPIAATATSVTSSISTSSFLTPAAAASTYVDVAGDTMTGTLITGSLTPTGPQNGSVVATHLATGVAVGFNATFSGSGWNYLSGSGNRAAAIVTDPSTGNIGFFTAPAGNAGAAAAMTAAFGVQPGGNALVMGQLSVGYAFGATSPILTASAPNWFTSLYSPDGSSGGSIQVGSAGASGFNYHSNAVHSFRNAAGSATYASFQSTGTYNLSGAWIVISDIATKVEESIEPYSRGLDAIAALSPVQFRYAEGNPLGADPSRTRFGLIAQDVAPHVPEIVGKTTATVGGKGGVELDTIEPGLLIYALINSCKELAARLAAIEARLAA